MSITCRCRACGCDVSGRQVQSGAAKRAGVDIYCVECSTRIADSAGAKSPSQDLATESLQVTAPHDPPMSSPEGSSRRLASTASGRQGLGLNAAPRQAEPTACAAGSSARHAVPDSRSGASGRTHAPSSSARIVSPSARRRRCSSRRIEAGSSTKRLEPAAASASRRGHSARGLGGQDRNRYSTRRTAPEGERSSAPLIALIAGGLVVVGLVALLAGGGASVSTKARSTVEGLQTPQEYVRLANEQLRQGNKPAAIRFLNKASEGWAEIGQDEEARRCSLRAYGIGKNATFGDLDR